MGPIPRVCPLSLALGLALEGLAKVAYTSISNTKALILNLIKPVLHSLHLQLQACMTRTVHGFNQYIDREFVGIIGKTRQNGLSSRIQ